MLCFTQAWGDSVSKLYKHFSEYQGEWPWKNFTPAEVSCRCCGELYLDPESMEALQLLRDIWGKPIIINSGHRCVARNASVGGADASLHLKLAFDCRCPAPEQDEFAALARQAGVAGIGRYPELNFVHLDLGPRREW